MPTNTLPIVGAFYRPPAKALIEALSIGTPLQLIAEPDNQYDPNAIAVYLCTTDIPDNAYDKLEEILPPYGYSLEQVMNEEYWHLGYVPKELAAKLVGTLGPEPMSVTFSLSSNGAPRVRREEPFPT
jgi:hypothetical protein